MSSGSLPSTAARVLIACAVVLGVLVPSEVRANASVELEVEPLNPQPGEPIHVRYGVSIRGESSAQVTPLDFGNLEVIAGGEPPNMPMMFGGGFGGGGFMMSIDTATDSIVRAPAPGRYTISNARVVDARNGRVIAQHPPVTIVVGGGGAAAQLPSDDAGTTPSVAASPATPPDPDMPPAGDLTGAEYNPNGFLRAAVDVANPYVGQQVILRIWLYVNSTQASCEVTQEPTLPGFWNEPLIQPTRECATRWFTENVGGRYMSVGLVRKIALFPSQAGRLTIGPATAGVDAISGGFFHSIVHLDARSPDLQIDVREPPAQGRPPDYVPGTVGPVNLVATADRTDPAVGETVTLTVRAVSDGSLESASITPPQHVDGVRIRSGSARSDHDLSSGRVQSILTSEILVVPERGGRFDLGDVTLPYWDPIHEQYGVAHAALPVIEAHGAALPAANTEHANNPEMEIRPLRETPSLQPYRPLISSGRAGVVLVAAPPVLLALAGFSSFVVRRVSRRRKVRADQRKHDPEALIREARRALASNPGEALSLAGRALDRVLSRVRGELEGGEDALPEEIRALVRAARRASDEARFAGANADARDVVDRVERVVRAIEGAL